MLSCAKSVERLFPAGRLELIESRSFPFGKKTDKAAASSTMISTKDEPVFHNLRKLGMKLADRARKAGVLFEGICNGAAGVQDGAVIAAAEIGANLLQRQPCEPACQVHAHLAR